MQEQKPQLEMIRTGDHRLAVPAAPDGYSLRQYGETDRAAYWKLFSIVYGSRSRLDDLRTAALPDGFFVIEHELSGDVVASAVAAEYDRIGHRERGSLQWVMADPAHTGIGLGIVVVAAASDRLAQANYSRAYLSTDDWRLPAISIYLKLGWKPLLFAPGMEKRWRAVLKDLGLPEAESEFVIELR